MDKPKATDLMHAARAEAGLRGFGDEEVVAPRLSESRAAARAPDTLLPPEADQNSGLGGPPMGHARPKSAPISLSAEISVKLACMPTPSVAAQRSS